MADVFKCVGNSRSLGEAARLLMPDVKIMRDYILELARDPRSYLGLISDIGRLVAHYIPDLDAIIREDPPAVPTWAAKFMARMLADGMPQRHTASAYINQWVTYSGSYIVVHCGMFLEIWGGSDGILPYFVCRHDFHAPHLTDINMLGDDHMLIITLPSTCTNPNTEIKTCKIYHVTSTVPLHTWQFPGNMPHGIRVTDIVFYESRPVLLHNANRKVLPGLMWIPNYFMLNVFTQKYVRLRMDTWIGANQTSTPPYTEGIQCNWNMIPIV